MERCHLRPSWFTAGPFRLFDFCGVMGVDITESDLIYFLFFDKLIKFGYNYQLGHGPGFSWYV